jgi:hypothetical protein
VGAVQEIVRGGGGGGDVLYSSCDDRESRIARGTRGYAPGLRHAGGTVLDLIASAILPSPVPYVVALWWLFGARTGTCGGTAPATTTISNNNQQTKRQAASRTKPKHSVITGQPDMTPLTAL